MKVLVAPGNASDLGGAALSIAQAVTIPFEELPQENWASGGKLHTELFGG